MRTVEHAASVARWQPMEITTHDAPPMADPLHDARLRATFTAPSGRQVAQEGFWDGGATWRVRLAPDEEGRWRYRLQLEEHVYQGEFHCTPAQGDSRFQRHGPVGLAPDKAHLVHADGTPFFWLGDTAWNGPLRSTPSEWAHYLTLRADQGFTGVQWVTTQWRAARSDVNGAVAFTGRDRIAVDPDFFRRMDSRVEALAAAGLLGAPVLLWAIGSGQNPAVNPGFGLPEGEAILLARYMVARWSAYPLFWILAGDGDYRGDKAQRWRRIGGAVFGDDHAPVAMHSQGRHWVADEFRAEPWFDIAGYQSGHGDSEETLRWIVSGPPAREWAREPRVLSLNLEPAYENHVAYDSRRPHTPHSVRRAIYWSLLTAPTAGVTYGGHGVWGWDDGSGPPMDHPTSGTPLPWSEALSMPGAQQMRHLADLFSTISWWTLRPDGGLLADQPGDRDVHAYIAAAADLDGDLALFYLPKGGEPLVRRARLASPFQATWFDPRTGAWQAATAKDEGETLMFHAPDEQDWLLLLQRSQKATDRENADKSEV